MSTIFWSMLARSLSALYLLQIGIHKTTSQSSSATSPPFTTFQCELITSEISTCRDLERRNTMYSFPFDRIGVDDTTFEALLFVTGREDISEQCIDYIVHLSCLGALRPCNPENNLPILICEENCRILQQIQAAQLCKAIDERFQEIAKFTTSDRVLLVFDLYYNFDCSDPSTYFYENITEADPDICTNLFSSESESLFLSELNDGITTVGTTYTTLQPQPQNDGILLVFILVPTLCVIFVTIVIVCGCSCYFALRKKGKTEDTKSFNFAELSSSAEVLDPPNTVKQNYMKVFRELVVPYQALEIGEMIGQGAFGKVFRGQYQRQDHTDEVALKTFKNVTCDSELKEFFSESVIMKDFHHPNVLGLLGVVFDTPDGVPHLVLPFMKNGNLKDYLKSRRVTASDIDTLPQDLDIAKLCTDIAQGMEYLAEKMFVHRDLAARNCMVSEELVVKVGDFGLARDVYSNDYYRASSKFARLPVKWMAPESFNDKISTVKTDVWSFGVTCWEVFSLGRTPYPTVPNSDIFSYISSGRRLEKPSLCPDKVFVLLETCWEHRPEDRPSFSQLTESLVEYWDQAHGYI